MKWRARIMGAVRLRMISEMMDSSVDVNESMKERSSSLPEKTQTVSRVGNAVMICLILLSIVLKSVISICSSQFLHVLEIYC